MSTRVKFTILGSGSSGNCALLETGKVRLLVDAGFSGKQIGLRLETLGLAIEQVDGVLLTHEHGDHTVGLPVLAQRKGVPVYCNEATSSALQRKVPKYSGWRHFRTGELFEIGDVAVQSFPVPHDAYEPVGFSIRAGGWSLGVVTDLGYATRAVTERVRDCEALLIEANYDPEMLRADTKRPWDVKQRIAARHGHLSNEAAAGLVAEIAGGHTKHIFLGHLSQDCNTHELARSCVAASLEQSGCGHVSLHETYQDRPTATLEW